MKHTLRACDCPFPPGLPKFNTARLMNMWLRYAGHDETAKEALILELLACSKVILLGLCRKYPKLRPIYGDVVGQVILATCEFIDIETLDPTKSIQAYYNRLVRHIAYAGMMETLIQSGRSRRHEQARGKRPTNRETLTEESCVFTNTPEYDTLDEVRQIIKTKRELEYVQLRMQGFSDLEIAAKLNLSHQRLTKFKTTLRKRYEDRQ